VYHSNLDRGVIKKKKNSIHFLSTSERKGNCFEDLRTLFGKQRPKSGLDHSGLDCLVCAIFARQRIAASVPLEKDAGSQEQGKGA